MPRPHPLRPLVSIAIPTYERGPLLDRALASALAQSAGDLEVVVSDNASTDDTPARLADWAGRDPRVRTLRQPVNRGPTANFNAVWEACRGAWVLSLSDDDHLAPEHLARCLAAVVGDDVVAVAVAAEHERGAEVVRRTVPSALEQPDPAARVRAFFATPGDGVFYALTRADVHRRARPMPNVLANDWLLGGRIAAQGRVRVLPDVALRRELGGTSSSVGEILATFGRGSLAARVPHLMMAWLVLADVGWRSPVHRDAVPHPARRAVLALACAVSVVDWPSLAWHLTAPAFLALARRPRGRPVARAYDRVTRALGAGA